MIRQGEGEPVVLLHGVMCSANVWGRVVPLLAEHCDAIALTALGHRGGPAAGGRPVTVADAVSDAERQLDELGLDRPHIAGNSLGGWIALELARRGRARSVCALSPAGCWDASSPEHGRASGRLRRVIGMTRIGRPGLPLAARSATVRRLAMRDNAEHGDRLTPREFVGMADDLLRCEIRDDILTTDEELAPLDPVPCPVLLAWAERDRVLPVHVDGARARRLVPQAQWRVLPGVGHVPMIDDPQLVSRTILDAMRLPRPQAAGLR